MSETAKYPYTEDELRAFNEGRQARLDGKDYCSSKYMRGEGRDLYMLCAWSEGWMSVRDERCAAAHEAGAA